ncbi:MAG: O-methyltransferase [Chitinophagaceae bacterium]|nr:O-methyltransferase [Chitinophagaceae bacterium]
MSAPQLITPEAAAYASQYSSLPDGLLKEIEDYTLANHPQSHMLSGALQGKFLSMLSTLLHPRYVLEIGTFTGYSALCLAEGLDNEGELHTIELREADAATARGFFSKSERNKQIFLHTGAAAELIPTIDRPWDLVFIDADKTGYIDYYELVVPRLSEKGVILADNVLFHGQVLENPVSGKNAKAIQAFNDHVLQDPRTEQVLLTIRDGLLLVKKKQA